MSAGAPALEDNDFERLYNQARRYDLLTLEQEREIDGNKWAAIHRIIEILLEDAHARHYLARWAVRCTEPLPRIEEFDNRKNRGLLRRELTKYLPGGTFAHKIAALSEDFRESCATEVLTTRLVELCLPSSLVVGMAQVLMGGDDGAPGGKVAAALKDWERLWPPRRCGTTGIAATTEKRLVREIGRYNSARDLLIVHNLRLVFTIAGRNRNKGVSFLDLVQEGNLGLLRAAEKFQFTRGYRFSTYAFNWITQAIKRHLADAAGSIRFPTHVQEQLGRVYGERGRILSRRGTAPLDSELASALGLPVASTRELLQLRNFAVSFEAPRFDEEEGETLLDSTPGGPFPEPGEEAEQSSLNQRILGEISRLDQAEQRVVIQRWGLHDGPPLSRAEIADQMSVSTEWVRLLERSALKKLRQSELMNAVHEDHLQS